jgi:hypothetical protein
MCERQRHWRYRNAIGTHLQFKITGTLTSGRQRSLDHNHLPDLIGILSSLLRDRSPLSIGSVAVAFEATCPTRLDLLHQHYRRLCRTLIDVDEWGQVALLDLLTRYVRVMLPKPSVIQIANGDLEEELDKDVHLLLTSCELLLQSQNSAVSDSNNPRNGAYRTGQVVVAVTRAIYYLGPPSWLHKIVRPLLRLLASSKDIERVVLAYIIMIATRHPVCHFGEPCSPLVDDAPFVFSSYRSFFSNTICVSSYFQTISAWLSHSKSDFCST